MKVLRWSALALGLVYGFSHQSSITARDKLAAAQAEYDRKANLISQAKNEWQKQHPPPQGQKDFDIETYLHLKD
jgi:F-type H+-transporting ATP synthase subunit e